MMTQLIGQTLRQAREERGESLEKVSQETRIRVHYLQAIESGNLDILPSRTQARGFIRTYAGYLGVEVGGHLAETGGRLPTIPHGTPKQTPSELPATASISETAELIFNDAGQQLRRQRELLGFSLQDVEQHTHVRVHHLQALEEGRFEQLPSPVQGRGMLKNYASFLGLDAEALLLRFAEGVQAQFAAKQVAKGRPKPRRSPSLPSWARRLASGDLIFGGLLIAGLVIFVIWGAIRITAMRAEQATQPTAPPLVQALLPSSTPPPTVRESTPSETPSANQAAQPDQVEETPVEPFPPFESGAVQVYVVVRQRAWMRVLVDGTLEFEGRVIPGSAYPFAGEQSVEVLTGNAAGLQIIHNQQDLGTLGIFGEVMYRIFTVDGVITPTPSITPTSTSLPLTTPTPTASLTPELIPAP